MRKWMSMILVLMLTATLLTGTALADGGAAAGTAAESPAPEAADETAAEDIFEGLDRLGEETEDCLMVQLTNGTGMDIRDLNIKRSDDWQWSPDLIPEGDVFVADEVCALCYDLTAPEEDESQEDDAGVEVPAEEETDPANAQPAPEAGAAEGAPAEEAEPPVLYDLQVVFSDRSVGVCHGVDLRLLQDVKLLRAWNGVVYLTYTDAATGQPVDMSEAEQAIAAGEAPAPGSDTEGANTEGCVGDSGLFY